MTIKDKLIKYFNEGGYGCNGGINNSVGHQSAERRLRDMISKKEIKLSYFFANPSNKGGMPYKVWGTKDTLLARFCEDDGKWYAVTPDGVYWSKPVDTETQAKALIKEA